MYHTQARPVRDLRNNYSEIEAMLSEHNPVVITKNGRGAAVVMNIEDFAGYEEYMYIRYVAEKLREAEEQANKPDATWHEVGDVIREFRSLYRGL